MLRAVPQQFGQLRVKQGLSARKRNGVVLLVAENTDCREHLREGKLFPSRWRRIGIAVVTGEIAPQERVELDHSIRFSRPYDPRHLDGACVRHT